MKNFTDKSHQKVFIKYFWQVFKRNGDSLYCFERLWCLLNNLQEGILYLALEFLFSNPCLTQHYSVMQMTTLTLLML